MTGGGPEEPDGTEPALEGARVRKSAVTGGRERRFESLIRGGGPV